MQIALTPVIHAYVVLCDPTLDWQARHSTPGQQMMVALRDGIALATGLRGEDVVDLAMKRGGVLRDIVMPEVASFAPPNGPTLTPDLEAVVRAALRVRELQKQYFKNRERDTLIASKDAEKALDILLQRLALMLPPPPATENNHV